MKPRFYTVRMQDYAGTSVFDRGRTCPITTGPTLISNHRTMAEAEAKAARLNTKEEANTMSQKPAFAVVTYGPKDHLYNASFHETYEVAYGAAQRISTDLNRDAWVCRIEARMYAKRGET